MIKLLACVAFFSAFVASASAGGFWQGIGDERWTLLPSRIKGQADHRAAVRSSDGRASLEITCSTRTLLEEIFLAVDDPHEFPAHFGAVFTLSDLVFATDAEAFSRRDGWLIEARIMKKEGLPDDLVHIALNLGNSTTDWALEELMKTGSISVRLVQSFRFLDYSSAPLEEEDTWSERWDSYKGIIEPIDLNFTAVGSSAAIRKVKSQCE